MADTISATFLIPQDTDRPLEMAFRYEALRMAVVDRGQWNSSVSSEWRCTGVYLLFGPPDDDAAGHYSVYVGKAAPGHIASRISAHVTNREGWDRALLVARSADGFNSTDVGWLEGRLHEVLSASPYAEVGNRTTPGDDTISTWDQEALERVVTLIRSVMKVLGYRTGTTELKPTSREETSAEVASFDAEEVHEIVRLIQPGEWTTYGDVAEAVGSHPRGIGAHIRNCSADAPEWRVLNRRGESQPGFTWTTRSMSGSQFEVLAAEGVPFPEGDCAGAEAMVDASELRRRLEDASRAD